MEPIRPEDLNLSALPRSPLGHLKADAVADLLQRAAWDYREAIAQNRRLTSIVEELTQRLEELTAQVDSLEAAAARHKDPDELARTLLASAQRAAREERESARREAELLLKKANRRAEQLEHNSTRDAEDRLSELTRIEELREEVIAQFRATLAAITSRDSNGSNLGSEIGDAAFRSAREL